SLVEPTPDPAAADPDRVTGELHAVSPRRRRAEAPAISAGVAENAGSLSNGFALARLRFAQRGLPEADILLGVSVEDREREAIRKRPVLSWPKRTRQRRLVSRVQLGCRRRGMNELLADRRPHRKIGRGDESLHREE